MIIQIAVHLLGKHGDIERLERDTADLRSELLQLHVDDVVPMPGGSPPPGSRSFDITTVGSLIVTVANELAAIRKVAEAVASWLPRMGTPYTAELVSGKDKLVVSGIDKATQKQLIDAWLRAHKLDKS